MVCKLIEPEFIYLWITSPHTSSNDFALQALSSHLAHAVIADDRFVTLVQFLVYVVLSYLHTAIQNSRRSRTPLKTYALIAAVVGGSLHAVKLGATFACFFFVGP